MKDNIAIKVSNVNKTFILPHEKQGSIKGLFVNVFNRKKTYEKQQALKDISFEIKKGEFFGIVGRNGSGKSTLLKLLAGIYTPDSGSIEVNGKLTPFIELGVGFNPELSGRENVFLNGALLGFSRKEMFAMYDEIVEFAELEKFMDQKLKNYSSGMQVRLAFSIAIRANTDILILDEVLAVGDSNFQKKCFDYFEKLKLQNKTVILVTHDMSAVERFCTRVLLVNKGRMLQQGNSAEITKEYSDLNLLNQSENLKTKKPKAQNYIKVKALLSVEGKELKHVKSTDKNFKLVYQIKSNESIKNIVFGTTIFNGSGTPIFATNTKATKLDVSLKKDNILTVEVEVENIFTNGEYSVALSVKDKNQSKIYYSEMEIMKFIVGGRTHDFALVSPHYKIEIR